MEPIKEALTFDDVLLLPQNSSIVPANTNLSVKLSKNIYDDVVKIKLKEVITHLDKTTEGKVVKDSQVSTLLMSYELVKELKKHANEKK